jgi:hypothetical protein
MNPIGKIAKEIGEEVAEKITKQPLKWGFKGRKPTDIKDLDYEDLEYKIGMGYRDIKNQRIINNEYNKLIKGSEKNKTLKNYVDYEDHPAYRSRAMKKAWKLGAINDRFKDLENIGVPRELTGKVLRNNRMMHEFDKIDDINPKYFSPDFEYYSTAKTEYKKYLNKWKKSLLRYYNELDDKQKETFDALSDEWEGSIDELIDAAKLL